MTYAPGTEAARLAQLHEHCYCRPAYRILGRSREVQVYEPADLQFYGPDTLVDMGIDVCPRCQHGYEVGPLPASEVALRRRRSSAVVAALVLVLLAGVVVLAVPALAVDCVGPDDPPGCVTPSPTPTVTVTETAPPAPSGPQPVEVTGVSGDAQVLLVFVASLSLATSAGLLVSQVRR